MAAPVPLRPDFDAAALRTLAKQSRNPDQTRRLLALATIYDGQPRSEAARSGCVTLQSVRDWVLRFNAQGPAGLINGKAPGRRAILSETQRATLQAIVEQGPIAAIHGVVRWRLVDLIAWVWEEFRLSISQQTLSRELRALGYRKLSARPRHHARSEAAVAAFKKTSPPVWKRSPRRSAASRSRSGSRMRRGLDKRTRSRGAGPNAARAPQRRRISERPRPISSARSVRLPAKERGLFCRAAPPRAWSCT
jgi:transposase